jgi:outer membrane lipoprotein
MRRLPALLLLSLLVSCSYAVQKDLIEEGTRNPDLNALIQNPDLYRDKLFIVGGVIARTTLSPAGSEVEALYAPVDSRGYPEPVTTSARRYLAVYPKDKGVLDPLLYKRDRNITIAGVFTGTTKGTVGKMEYVFPVFTIVRISLEREVRYVDVYPHYYPYPGYWEGWGPPYWWW